VLDDLHSVRSYTLDHLPDLGAAVEMKPEVHERLRRPGILPRVQRKIEAVRVANDDRPVRVPLRGSRRGLIVVVDGGVLSEVEINEIVLAEGELTELAFVAQDKVSILVTPLLARRVASCLEALTTRTVAALENGSPAL
jgi:hypothetical protein